jgi:hypothetical protein
LVDTVHGYNGSKSTVEMDGIVCATSSRTIGLDSREELLEQFESKVNRAISVAAEVNDKLLLLQPYSIDEENLYRCLRDKEFLCGWVKRLVVVASGRKAW